MAASTEVKRAKKRKGKVINFDEVGEWKKVEVDPNIFIDGDFSGFSGLEELTNFDVSKLYGDAKKCEKQKKEKKRKLVNEQPPKKKRKRVALSLGKSHKQSTATRRRKSGREIYKEIIQKRKERKMAEKKEEPVNMSAWDDLPVPDLVLKALKDLGFTKPTPIQAECLTAAIEERNDVVGGAETGSGKTLAFGIPLLEMYLARRGKGYSGKVAKPSTEGSDKLIDKRTDGTIADQSKKSKACDAEISLGLDANQSLNEGESVEMPDSGAAAVKTNKKADVKNDAEVERVVSGDNSNPDDALSAGQDTSSGLMALILTPTRELAVQIKNHIMAAAKYTDVQVAVVVGGMSLEKQSRILKRKPEIVVGTPGRIWELYQQEEPHLLTLSSIKCLVIDEADRMVEKKHFAELTEILGILNCSQQKAQRQTLVFSATLSLVHHGPLRKLLNWKDRSQGQILGSLMDKIGIKRDAKIVDLTQKEGTVASLLESKIFCSVEQKDIYLFYFLMQYPGRTLVFCNSIDCIRRLVSILTILQRSPFPLHSSMHQRQRLKNLERFTENPNGLLLATDVASRGLDIPNVQHVIHYQVPRTTEIYIHRSGRTARQEKQGLSLLLLSTKEISYYRRVCKTLDKEEIVNFPVDHQYLREVTDRVELARDIDTLTHQFEKKKHKNEWFQQAAKEMDLELEEDQVLEDLGTSHEQKMRRMKLTMFKQQLKFLLKRKIFPSGHSQLYITSSGTLLAPMLEGNQKDKQNALTKLITDKQFNKSRKKGEEWKKKKREMAEEAGEIPEKKSTKKKVRNKYHHLGRKGDQKKSAEG
ncbi:ATP-dependent RNA helicase DDX24-like [Apostichopus japonicus]|uniref:ATP-dependent RNA helicase DDX24-like n=1 Tax=Stichopus japonicus TaxID=307972 RepID=UPI003AB3B810